MTVLRLWCSCGGALDARSSSVEWLASIRQAWESIHDGDGHRPATSREAAAARWKQKQEAAG